MQEREFAYIHEHNFDDKMWSIAGKVDFLGLMEAGEFAVILCIFSVLPAAWQKCLGWQEGCYLFKGVAQEVIQRPGSPHAPALAEP